MPEILLTPEVAFRGLNRGMAQQELNLLDLAAVAVAQLSAGPSQVVRRDVLQSSLFAAGPCRRTRQRFAKCLGPTLFQFWRLREGFCPA